jgi:carboxyl-terminal processing protease
MNLGMSKWMLAVVLALISGAVLATSAETSIDKLEPSHSQRQTALIITKVMDRYHYRNLPLDDSLSSSILDRYIESLDPNKSFFTQQDISDFEKYRHSLDEAITSARLAPAFEIFKRFRQRVDERTDLALSLLKQNKFDFTVQESYRFDREDAQWAKDETAIKELWRMRVKNDILGLRLAGKEDDKIVETLEKRYHNITHRTRQFESDDVFQAFINAYTLSVEPHTAYMSPERSENFDISMRLSLQGIGAVLRNDNEYTTIQSTVTGGPADKSGQLKSGDRIIGVAQGGKGEMLDIIGWRLQDVVEIIRGTKGTLVRLNVLPKSSGEDGKSKEVSIIRDEIKLEDQAVKSTIIEDLPGLEGMKFGVLDIPAFYRDFRGQAVGKDDFRSTTRDVRKLLAELTIKKVDGIIVDLRGNGGGSLTEATELTGLFIKEGPVVQVRDSQGRLEIERDLDPEQVYSGPLVVMVNRNSASASEIFAGAIQDYHRGLVIGEPTFGKGTVQTLVDLGQFSRGSEDLGRLRLTIAQFFRVQGGSTQNRGVVPDILFPTATAAADHGERSLDNALPWATIQSVAHQKHGTTAVAGLREASDRRILKDPGFSFLLEQEQAIKEIQDRKMVTLMESERKKEYSVREASQLERRNKLRVYRELEPLTKLNDEDEDTVDDSTDKDPEGVNRIMQDEAAKVLADLIRQQRPVTAQAH